ncbi:2'-5' RNA ligase family protein [Streptomyces antnestii]|uniref:2'-5' RNA ligase family protein n=1 Tax=Streptomyces antnestii TaxID=2494256 RepID=UPI001CB98A60|nr:2'-5' RNA ligase family protein [Streptomyces sp. San01]
MAAVGEGRAPEDRSALVIILPWANPLLEAAAEVTPGLIRKGLPAHVSLLYPFLPVAELTGPVDTEVRDLAASLRTVETELTDFVEAPGFVGVAVPALRPVADAFYGRWPHIVPYGGRFGERPEPHVTLVTGATDEEAALVRERARPLLPLSGAAWRVDLVVRTDRDWRLRLTAPFAASP